MGILANFVAHISLPGINFTKFLCAAFTSEDPKSGKNKVKPSVFFGGYSDLRT